MIGMIIKLFETTTGQSEEPENLQEVSLCMPLTDTFAANLIVIIEQICPIFVCQKDLLHLKSILGTRTQELGPNVDEDSFSVFVDIVDAIDTRNDPDHEESVPLETATSNTVDHNSENFLVKEEHNVDPFEEIVTYSSHKNKLENKSQRCASRTTRKEYACVVDQCGEKFRLPHQLKKHHRLDHIDLFCPACRQVFANLADFSCHLCSKLQKCTACEREFNTEYELKSHQLVHTDVKAHTCHSCGKSFRQAVSLRRHAITHESEGKFACPTCGKMFKFKHYLSQHRLLHSGLKPHSCEFCPKEFTQRSNLVKHIQAVHTLEKNYSCTLCKKSFVKPYYLKRHLLTHKDEALKYFPSLLEATSSSDECFNLRQTRCLLCPATVKDEKSLESHIARIHPDRLLDENLKAGPMYHLGLASWSR